MEDVTETEERLPGTETAIIQEPVRAPGTSQESAREPSTSQEGAREPSTSQEGAREASTSQEGAREASTSQEGAREQSTSQEGAREQSTSQEGAREVSTSQEGARELSTSQEGAREPGNDGATEPSTSQEGAAEPSTSQEGAAEPSTSQEGAAEPTTSQEGATEPSTSQEGATEPSTSQEGATEPSTSQEGATEPSTSQEGATEPSTSQEGATEPSTEDTREKSTSQEGIRGLGADIGEDSGQIEDTEPSRAVEEYGEEPGDSLRDDPSEPKDDELQMAEETDQEPSLELKEDSQPLVEEQEEDQEETEDPELQEMADDEQIREEVTLQYHALVQDRDKIQQHNAQLQHKLYEYFRKKKGEETRPETSKRAADQEQRYIRYLSTLEEMRRKHQEEAALHQQQIEELRAQCQDIVSKVDKEWTAFQEQKKKVSLCSISKQGAGKHAASSLIQEVELLQSKEERKEKEVIQVRLENIKLKNQINRCESTLRSKEELAEGLHLIDFEQLKIENQTYNEKIEERNEELLKLRKKITNTVQVLTHVKEKLQFVQAENHDQKEKLLEVEAVVGNKRDVLTKTKQARDSLRIGNLNLKQKCGLLGNKVLLRDFEEKVDATEELRQTLENLKRRHAELTLSSKGLMKKVDETKLLMDT